MTTSNWFIVNGFGAGMAIAAMVFACNGSDREMCIIVAVIGAAISAVAVAGLGIKSDRDAGNGGDWYV